MVLYLTPGLLGQVCDEDPGLVGDIVEVLASVLDTEEDDEGHLACLLVIKDLMIKDKDSGGLFLEQFAKLGLYPKVHALSEGASDDEGLMSASGACGSDKNDSTMITSPPKEDATDITSERAYSWRDWSIARGRDCLYIWSDVCALELSNGSNGWFRFILDGKLATMYSHGSPETGTDTTENRTEFLEKLQVARSSVRSNSSIHNVFTKGDETGSATIAVGNWTLSSKKDGELTIVNTDATQQQATILKEELPGFIFESNRGTRHSFTAETSLGPEFPAGWAGKKTKRLRNKAEALKQKVRSTARKVYENHFREAQSQPRGVVAKLTQIVTLVDKACQKQVINEGEWKILMTSALEELTELLGDDTKVSAYELHSSGLIQSLLKLFATSSTHQSAYPSNENEKARRRAAKLQKHRVEIFRKCFLNGQPSGSGPSPAYQLARKLVTVLESIEKLPVYLYDYNNAGFGLQILARRLRFKLEPDLACRFWPGD